MDAVARWLAGSPYAHSLGVVCDSATDTRVRLALPYRDENSNPGRALHGGVAASLVVLGAGALARGALGAEAAPWHTAAVQISYLSAAIGENVVADARLLRKGKELVFVDVSVETPDGRGVARAGVTVRGRFGAPESAPPAVIGQDTPGDPGPMGAHLGRAPFMGRLGIHVEHMRGGQSRILLPFSDRNAGAGGGVDEGAVLALLDTTGAMAAWALTGPGRYKASTPALQAQILAPPPAGDLVGYGSVVHRDGEHFLCDVEIGSTPTRGVVARGTVVYRIVQ